jgi:tRNA 2-thiocytidine biosynthesis protein TtcA
MTRLEKKILNEIDQANDIWQLFSEGERVLLGVSGGKDSIALYHLLKYYPLKLEALHIRLSSRFSIDFIAQNNFADKIEVIETNIYDKIKTSDNNLSTCFVCSRERRKKILEYAKDKGIRKIVFGHHRNDVVETLLLNLLFSREISTLLPKQTLFKGEFEIIRPLYLVEEQLLISLQREKGWQISKPVCEESLSSKRQYLRDLLTQIQKQHPKIDIRDNIFSSLRSIKTSFMPFPVIEQGGGSDGE